MLPIKADKRIFQNLVEMILPFPFFNLKQGNRGGNREIGGHHTYFSNVSSFLGGNRGTPYLFFQCFFFLVTFILFCS